MKDPTGETVPEHGPGTRSRNTVPEHGRENLTPSLLYLANSLDRR